jgi:ABC-type methionine transport system ATPase subunit
VTSLRTIVKTKKNIHFEFNQELVRQPLLYQLNRQFDVVVNIRGASVTDEGGFIALELEGETGEVERVMEFLRGLGVEVGEGLGSA